MGRKKFKERAELGALGNYSEWVRAWEWIVIVHVPDNGTPANQRTMQMSSLLSATQPSMPASQRNFSTDCLNNGPVLKIIAQSASLTDVDGYAHFLQMLAKLEQAKSSRSTTTRTTTLRHCEPQYGIFVPSTYVYLYIGPINQDYIGN